MAKSWYQRLRFGGQVFNGGVTAGQTREALHHFSEMLRDDRTVDVPAAPGSQQTGTMGEPKAGHQGKLFAILDGELTGVCDSWEATREPVDKINFPAG